MATTTMFLEDLAVLAKDTAGGEWREIYDSAVALDPAEMPGTIEIAVNYYGDYMADGWHRTAGMLRWAEREGADTGDVEITVSVPDGHWSV